MKNPRYIVAFVALGWHCALYAAVEVSLFNMQTNSWRILNCGPDMYNDHLHCIIYQHPNLWNGAQVLNLSLQDNGYLAVQQPDGVSEYWVLPGQESQLQQILSYAPPNNVFQWTAFGCH